MIQEVGKLTSFQELYSFFGKALITKAQSRKKKKNTAAVSHTNSTSETLTGIYEDITVVIKKQLILSDV